MILDDIKTAGIYWLKEEIKDKSGEAKAYAWWGICKKTRKVAFMRVITNTLYEIMPIVMNDICFCEGESCDDGKFCLNLDCPYSTNVNLITSILKQCPLYEELESRAVEDYFKRSIKFIEKEFIDGLSEEELNKIFVTDFTACTVNENAFGTTLGGDD